MTVFFHIPFIFRIYSLHKESKSFMKFIPKNHLISMTNSQKLINTIKSLSN